MTKNPALKTWPPLYGESVANLFLVKVPYNKYIYIFILNIDKIYISYRLFIFYRLHRKMPGIQTYYFRVAEMLALVSLVKVTLDSRVSRV